MTIVDLPEGEHQYKFVVDGRWEHDPNQVIFKTIFVSKLYISTKRINSQQLMILLMVKTILSLLKRVILK